MKIKEIRQKNSKELQDNLASFRERLREMRFNLASGKVKNIREVHRTKKNIAKILTILKENGAKQNQ